MGLPLSNFLQKSNIDLKLAVQLANDIKQEMQELRTNTGKIFKLIFEQIRILSEKFNIEIRIPRLSTRQMHRYNIPISSPEQYYRALIFIPYFDKFISELGERFTNHQVILSGFDSLFKKNNHLEDFKNLSDKYTDDLENNGSNNIILETEYKLWQRLLKQTNKKPHNSMEAITLCNKTIYPNIFKLLQILVTLPGSTSSNERTFSNLKRIKTYLRNSISEGRLNGLAMLSINSKDIITPTEVIEELAKKKKIGLPFSI